MGVINPQSYNSPRQLVISEGDSNISHDAQLDSISALSAHKEDESHTDSTRNPNPKNSEGHWSWLEGLEAGTIPAENAAPEVPFPASHPSITECLPPQDLPTRDRIPSFEVTWQENDDENPKNWPAWYRGLTLGFTSFATLTVVIASTAYVTTIPGVMADFGITDRTVPVLGVTTYLFGLAVGPLILAPLGETFGRRPVYAVTLFLFAVLLIPSAVAKNIATILATRFLAAFVGSVMLSNAPGTINDIATDETRALYVSVWIFGAVSGPVLGPVIAGLVYVARGWRWVHWTIVILAFASAIFMASLKETFTPAILHRRYVKSKKEDDRYWSKYEDFGRGSLKAKLEVSMKRPIVMALTEPICLLWNTYIAILYALLYLSIVGYPTVFQQIRHWAPNVAGLPFLAIGLGSLVCILIEPYMRRLIKAVDMFSRQKKLANGTETAIPPPLSPEPEATVPLIFVGGLLVPVGMLLFALTASPPNSAVVAILSGVPFGMGNMLVIIYVTNYLASCYGPHAASAIAGNAVMRNLIGGVLPLLAPVLYGRLGPLVTDLILMAIALVLAIVPLLFWKWGRQLRSRSQLASTPK
ncbi:putative caffeine resistance protein [Nemania diffusa]|nr:putative caffeine resistance protein [Nemania diffusa]